jgi:eukaryotic-like serine/threonine-protein kinase
MALESGSRIGSYEVLELIGHGGMGEVYRARDLKLNRDVAIKILPDHLARDTARLARLQREAQMLAALNHPHIAQIHGLEDSRGVPALVLELVEGPTLADRISQGPFQVHEALDTARQIAEALETAHDKGVVHRDLKPANIKLTANGSVKVLDFGLARALAGETPDLSLVTAEQTGDGIVLGTAAYMSPEQARGQSVDRRTDVWAFGCVLFEMLAGRRAFGGDTLSDTLASVLTSEPDWTAVPAAVPASVTRLIRRCLEKNLRRRLRDIGDARIGIEDAREAPARENVTVTNRRGVTRRTVIGTLAGAAAGAAAMGGFTVASRRAVAARDLM